MAANRHLRAPDLILLKAYCEAISLHEEASAQIHRLGVLVSGPSGPMVNPLIRVQKDAAQTMRQLADVLGLNPIGAHPRRAPGGRRRQPRARDPRPPGRRDRQGRQVSRARLYISVVADVLEARDFRCESCGAPDIEHVHHIVPVSETGICSELAIEPANMMVLCNDCHVLFHPGSRNRNMWWHMQLVADARGRSLGAFR